MAKYNAIKAAVNAYIKENGRKEITGKILNAVLNATIDSLGRFFQFAGGALPTDDPGTPDQNVCYLAGEPGVYTHFGNITIENEEVALLLWDGVWKKQSITIGIQEVDASVDDQVGTPSVDVSYSEGRLVLTFHNMKGEPGENGAAAGFGTIDALIGEGPYPGPRVFVSTSGPNTAKNIEFDFVNIKGDKGDKGEPGETGDPGVTSVIASVDNNTGIPSVDVQLNNGVLTLSFHNIKGAQGDTGSSIDYPFTLVNNTTTDDPLQALSAAMGKFLQDQILQSASDIGDMSELMTENKDSLVGAINEAGMSGAAKTALFALLEKVAYTDEHGQDYLEALYALLFPGIVSIDAVFTQGQAVIYDEDDLSTLKQYLVVTAIYQDSTTRVLPDIAYVLTGTLEAGISTITVTYAGKTDTFSVLVTATPREDLFGVFTDGYAVSKITATGSEHYLKTYRSSVAARATTQLPFENKGYVFMVTDATKYNIAAYDIESLTQVTAPPNVGAVDPYAFMGGSKSVSWKTQDSVSTPYVWLALKKMDGTAFTAAELADGAAAVFTFTKNQ